VKLLLFLEPRKVNIEALLSLLNALELLAKIKLFELKLNLLLLMTNFWLVVRRLVHQGVVLVVLGGQRSLLVSLCFVLKSFVRQQLRVDLLGQQLIPKKLINSLLFGAIFIWVRLWVVVESHPVPIFFRFKIDALFTRF
jgi:hypothetical protein